MLIRCAQVQVTQIKYIMCAVARRAAPAFLRSFHTPSHLDLIFNCTDKKSYLTNDFASRDQVLKNLRPEFLAVGCIMRDSVATTEVGRARSPKHGGVLRGRPGK